MSKRKKYIDPTPCMIVELHSDSNDAIYKGICKSNDISFCKDVGRRLWQVASKPDCIKIKNQFDKVIWIGILKNGKLQEKTL